MKTILSIFLLLASFGYCLATENPNRTASSYLVTYEVDSTLSASDVKVKISCTFSSYHKHEKRKLRYGLNGSNASAKFSSNYEVVITPAAGKYRCQFYCNADFMEIETDTIEVKAGVCTHIHLDFQSSYRNIRVKKPVIYLYPEITTDVSVGLKTTGELTFTYPQLNNGWNVTAQPDGTLTSNGKTYPYLFWEADQQVQNPFELKSFEGFVVEGKNAVSFLEEKLTQMGFNDRERTDFITFWGPQLAANEFNNITFQFNETCDVYATLDIVPQPESLNRVYMIWSKSDFPALDTITPQVLPVLDRSGFDVLEWGGVEVNDFEL